MSDLFDRVAILEMGTPGGAGVRVDSRGEGDAEEGLRIAFDVVKTIQSSANTATIQIYNLSEGRRAEVVAGNVVRLQAGYADAPELVYEGTVTRAETQRSGADVITTIECGDGVEEFKAQTIKKSFPAGTSVRAVVLAVTKQFTESIPDEKANQVRFDKQPRKKKASRLSVRSLDADLRRLESSLSTQGFSTVLRRPMAVAGNAREVMDRLARMWRFFWSVQDGAIQVVADGQSLGGSSILLSPETGLLGIPVKTDYGVKTTSLLIPSLRPGATMTVKSETLEDQFIVETVQLQGDTRGQSWTAEVEGRA